VRLSTFSEFWRKQRDRWDRRAIDRRHGLRRHLIHHVNRHGFEIGDYSIGAPKILFFDDGCRLTVGKFCSLAMGSTFVLGGSHRTEFVSTFPFGHMTGEVGPSDWTRSRGDVVIGSDVWIAANATILSGVTVGHGAVVGAGSVVIDDVPPCAVVLGNPARVVSKRFSDDVIADLLELRWWDLDDSQVGALRPLLESADIGAFIDACRAVRGLSARARRDVSPAPAPKAAAVTGDLAAEVVAIIQAAHLSFSAADMERPLKSLGIDSFTTLVIRARIEAAIGRAIDDGRWMAATTAGDIVRAIGTGGTAVSLASRPAAAVERRSYELNMPQMALGGLSESWLFKELGDIHWRLIARGLGRPSHEIADVNGDRLYATFTRFRLDSSAGLAAYRENERIELEAQASRYGAGLYFSEVTAAGDDRRLRGELMSSFAKVGEAASNTSLLRGQPEIPPDCGIPAVGELPAFASAYRERRAAPLPAPLFECEYEIVPSHDINGVGLLYFAAYPTINDICAARYAGRSLTASYSTQARDVFYFGNCDPDETLIFRLHRWDAAADRIEMEGSISRKSDGGLMAAIITTKQAGAGYAASQAGRPQS
jgi:probable biosynthetic protein (TIGR04098 family)